MDTPARNLCKILIFLNKILKFLTVPYKTVTYPSDYNCTFDIFRDGLHGSFLIHGRRMKSAETEVTEKREKRKVQQDHVLHNDVQTSLKFLSLCTSKISN